MSVNMEFWQIITYIIGAKATAYAVFCVGACALVWWVTRKMTKFEARLGRAEQRPCEDHGRSITELTALSGKIDLLCMLALQQQPKAAGADMFSQKHSPRSLNGNGRKVAEVFGVGGFLEANGEWLIGEMGRLSPGTPLDVEAMSLAVLRLRSGDKRFNGLKGKVYRSPVMELEGKDGGTQATDITLDNVLYVMSLLLRDMYLERHPELMDE